MENSTLKGFRLASSLYLKPMERVCWLY